MNEEKELVTKEQLDDAMLQAILQSITDIKSPWDILKMLAGTRATFDATFEGTPLKIDLKIGKDVQIRLRRADE